MRIASLLPSATEIVCSLGLEDALVAVTHECDYPESVRVKPILTRSVLSEASTGVEVDRHIRELVHQGSSIYALDAGLPAILSSIAAVESHPSQYSGPPITKRPITSLRRAMIIKSTITGTASTPFTTALQYSAEIGLIAVKLSAIPIPADNASTV